MLTKQINEKVDCHYEDFIIRFYIFKISKASPRDHTTIYLIEMLF